MTHDGLRPRTAARNDNTARPTFLSHPALVSGMPTRREALALRAVRPTARRQEKERPGIFIERSCASLHRTLAAGIRLDLDLAKRHLGLEP